MSDLEWWYVYSIVAALVWMGGMLAIPRMSNLQDRLMGGTTMRPDLTSDVRTSSTPVKPERSPGRSQSTGHSSGKLASERRMASRASAKIGMTGCTERNGETWEVYHGRDRLEVASHRI